MQARPFLLMPFQPTDLPKNYVPFDTSADAPTDTCSSETSVPAFPMAAPVDARAVRPHGQALDRRGEARRRALIYPYVCDPRPVSAYRLPDVWQKRQRAVVTPKPRAAVAKPPEGPPAETAWRQ